jgi:hypothetical protein
MSIIPHKGDIRLQFLDDEPASSLDVLGWRGAVMSPFDPAGDLAGTPVLFSLSVRNMRCSQVEQDVLRQEAAVLRYASSVIRTKRAQKSAPFSGMAYDVLAPLQVEPPTWISSHRSHPRSPREPRDPTPTPAIPPEILQKVIVGGGDLGELDAAQRAEYYAAVCKSLGLNPMTKPFEYLTLNGKLRLYALRDCADQLRRLHGISIYIANREKIVDIYVVTARAKDRTGREDESTGAVPLGNLRGDALANALMKAETKAKRRVTLSIAGLGWLDETELETVKGAVTGASDTPVATIHDAVLDDRAVPATEPPEVTRHMAGLREERRQGAAHGNSEAAPRASRKPTRQQPSAGPSALGVDDIPEGIQAVIKSILSRVVGLYPGDKADPTVLEDRKNILHAIFGREIDSGMAGVRQLAELGFDALRDGLAKLDRVQREAPPLDPTAGDDRPVHPDITATGELLASLQARAGRAGVSPEAY